MKEIKLTQGKLALVDDEYFEYLNQFKWFAHKKKNGFYAERNIPIDNCKQKTQMMHRIILGDIPKILDVDHIDGNGLNNQKYNLRSCTHQQNMMNRKSNKNTSSKYRGVTWDKKTRKWYVSIFTNYKRIYIGYFINEIEAALAYNKAALVAYGSFARLNTII